MLDHGISLMFYQTCFSKRGGKKTTTIAAGSQTERDFTIALPATRNMKMRAGGGLDVLNFEEGRKKLTAQ
jgi:hypothetical protein